MKRLLCVVALPAMCYVQKARAQENVTDAFVDLKRTGVVAEQDSKMRKAAYQHLRS